MQIVASLGLIGQEAGLIQQDTVLQVSQRVSSKLLGIMGPSVCITRGRLPFVFFLQENLLLAPWHL